MKKILLHSCFTLFAGFAMAQQDPQYSQYLFNQVIINPAYVGSKDAINATGVFRKEWVRVNGAPQTINLSVSGALKAKRIGLGMHIVQESIGPKLWTSAYADYCYRLKLGKGKLAMGLSTGIISYQFNTTKLNLQDEYDPNIASGSVMRSVKFDLSAGAYYNSRSFFAGISVTHLNKPNLYNSPADNSNTFYALNRHVFVTVGKAFELNKHVVFSPSVMVKAVGPKYMTADFNAHFLLKEKLWLGASYRTSGSVNAIAQVLVTDKLKIGYSYDYGVKGIARLSSGSHEIMMSYDFGMGKSRMVTSKFL